MGGAKHKGFSQRHGGVRAFDAGVKILMLGHQIELDTQMERIKIMAQSVPGVTSKI